MKKTYPAADLKGCTFTPSADASKTVVLHPCNAWASSAGYESWQSALAAMHDGKVICGSQFAVSRPGAKTVMGMQLFLEQVAAETLHSLATEDGILMVGLKSDFPAELLAEEEARMEDLRDKLRAMMSPRN